MITLRLKKNIRLTEPISTEMSKRIDPRLLTTITSTKSALVPIRLIGITLTADWGIIEVKNTERKTSIKKNSQKAKEIIRIGVKGNRFLVIIQDPALIV